MKCNSARKILSVSEYPELVSEELLDAKRHLRECAECRDFLEGERAFGALLRSSVIKEEVPPELYKLVRGATKGRKGGSFTGFYRRLAIAASVLLIVVAGYVVTLRQDASPLIGQIVNDHIQFLPSPDMQISSSDPAEIKAWFRGKVNFAVNVPRLSAKLQGGRLCFLDGKRLALLFYEHNDVPISLFVTGNLDGREAKTGREVIIKGKNMRHVEDRGFNLLIWREEGLSYALVSELRIEELEKII